MPRKKRLHAIAEYHRFGGFNITVEITCRCGWEFEHYNAGYAKEKFKEHQEVMLKIGEW